MGCRIPETAIDFPSLLSRSPIGPHLIQLEKFKELAYISEHLKEVGGLEGCGCEPASYSHDHAKRIKVFILEVGQVRPGFDTCLFCLFYFRAK
jgi:hypothetical protein